MIMQSKDKNRYGDTSLPTTKWVHDNIADVNDTLANIYTATECDDRYVTKPPVLKIFDEKEFVLSNPITQEFRVQIRYGEYYVIRGNYGSDSVEFEYEGYIGASDDKGEVVIQLSSDPLMELTFVYESDDYKRVLPVSNITYCASCREEPDEYTLKSHFIPFDNQIVTISSTSFVDYVHEKVPDGYEYVGLTTDWFPIIDYTKEAATEVLLQFKVDTTRFHQKGPNASDGILVYVRFVSTSMEPKQYDKVNALKLFYPGTNALQSTSIPVQFYNVNVIGLYLYETEGCYISPNSTQSSAFDCISNNGSMVVTFNKDATTATNLDIKITSRTSKWSSRKHECMTLCYSLPLNRSSHVSSLRYWYNGKPVSEVPPIEYKFKKLSVY